jgi:hypothetical protein
MRATTIALLLTLTASLTAQNPTNQLPEGDFEQAGITWTQVSFNDPLGTTGFVAARVQGQGPSPALYADFQTLSPVMSAHWRSQPILLANTVENVGFAVAWTKPNATPMASPTVNRVELRVLDANLALVTSVRLNAPSVASVVERARFDGTVTVPAPGLYHVDLFLRHSNLAGIPFQCEVDDVYVGAPAVAFFGQGCAGTGAVTPTLQAAGTPNVGNAGFALGLHDAQPGALAFCLAGLGTTSWPGGSLPWPLGGGCELLIDPVAIVPHVVVGPNPGEGTAAQPFAVPLDPGLTGVTLVTQWGAQDPASPSPFGYAVTAGMSFTIQP